MKKLTVLAALSGVALLLAGCSGSTEPTGDAESGKVTFAYSGDADVQGKYAPLFEEFNDLYPGIEIKAQAIPASGWADFLNTVATQLAGGQTLDVIYVPTEGQRLFASKGILENLDSYIDADQDYVDAYYGDLNPRLLELHQKYAAGADGETVFIPGGYNTMGLYLNKRVFEAAGVEIPEDGNWTWDEFREAGRTIKAKTGAYLMSMATSPFTDIMPWLTTNGGSTFNEDWTEPTFNNPEAAEAAEFARNLVEEGLVPQPGGTFDVYSAYSKDQLAAVPGGRWPILNLRELDQVENSVFVKWPTNTGNGSPIGWDAWGITKASTNKQAAWTFVKFLMSKESGPLSSGGTSVPARISVAESSISKDSPEGSERLMQAVDYATAIPSIDEGAEAYRIIQEAWLTIMTGNGEIQPTLDNAQTALEALVVE